MASRVERQSPELKNDWKVTYSTGSQKWTNNRPGDGVGEASGELLEATLSEVAVQRGLGTIQKAIEAEKGLESAVKALVRDTGTEKGRTVLNAVYKGAKGANMSEQIVDGWDAARKMVAAKVKFRRQDVAQFRKDFLTLMKNEKRVRNYDEARTWAELMNAWSNGMEQFVFKDVVRAIKQIDTADWIKKDWENVVKKDLWSLVVGARVPLNYIGDYWSKERSFADMQDRMKKWSSRVRREARQAWKTLSEFLEWYETNKEKEFEVERPEREKVTIEGFTVLIEPDPDFEVSVPQYVGYLKEVLKRFNANAAKRAPILLKYKLPLEYDFTCDLNLGGRYNSGRSITICPLGMREINNGVHIVAHEHGHHIWTTIGGAAQKRWELMIKGHTTEIDLRDVLLEYPTERAFWNSDQVKAKDPVLYLQLKGLTSVHGLGLGRGILSRDELQEFISKSGPKVKVSVKPITGYASKNSEEAFCEALGLLVAYGPSTVPEEVRYVLSHIMPRGVKVSSSPLRVRRDYGGDDLEEEIARRLLMVAIEAFTG
jgi:hypothetical protein